MSAPTATVRHRYKTRPPLFAFASTLRLFKTRPPLYFLHLFSFSLLSLALTASAEDPYVATSGTQYFLTDFCASPATKAVLDFQMTADSNQQRFFGADFDNSTGLFSFSFYRNGSAQFAWAAQNNSGNWTSTGQAVNTTTRWTFTLDSYKNAYDLRATGASSATKSGKLGTTRTQTAKYPLALAAANRGSSGIVLTCRERIYSFKLYSSGLLRRCYVPSWDSTRTGLVEMVTGSFVTNKWTSGTASLAVGGDLSSDLSSYVEGDEGVRWSNEKSRLELRVIAKADGDAAGSVKFATSSAAAAVTNWYVGGESFSVTAIPADDHAFDHWESSEGTLSATERAYPVLTCPASAHLVLTAVFAEGVNSNDTGYAYIDGKWCFGVGVSSHGTGGGSVEYELNGTTQYGPDVTNWLATAQTVTYRAEPDAGSSFQCWSGETDGLTAEQLATANLSITVDRPRRLQAVFLSGPCWLYLPLSTPAISNTATHCVIDVTTSGKNLTLKYLGFHIPSDGQPVAVDLTQPIFGADYQTTYMLVGVADEAFARWENSNYSRLKYLTELLLPDTVTSMGTAICCIEHSSIPTALRRVRLPRGLTSIGWASFEYNTNLTELVDGWPTTITAVPAKLFRGCYKLTNRIDLSSVTSIGANSFENCSAAKFSDDDGIMRLTKCTSFGSASFNGCTKLTGIDFGPDNVLTYFGGTKPSSLVKITPFLPSSVSSLGSSEAMRNSKVAGDLVLSNPKLTSIPTGFFRGSPLGSIDMTGSGITSALGDSSTFTMGKTLTNLTFSAVFSAFPNYSNGLFYDSSGIGSKGFTSHFRGDPPSIPRDMGYGNFYNGFVFPKWNAKWNALVANPSAYPEVTAAASKVAEITAASIKEFRKNCANDPIPVQTICYGGYGTARPSWIRWWYPDAPTPQTPEPLNYWDVIRYDGGSPIPSGENDGRDAGCGPTNLFNGTTYVLNTTDSTVAGYRNKERWLGKADAAVEMEIPSTCPTARSLKLTSYRLYQLSGSDWANARAPTAWTLKGKLAGSDAWTVIDTRSDAQWVSVTNSTDYPYTQSCTVPPRTACWLDFDVPVAQQGVYTAFRFEPTGSYLLTSDPSQTYLYGLMELEFYGKIPTPDPVVSDFAATRDGWTDLAFSATLSSLGEKPAEQLKATWAKGKVEVSTTSDFATIAATSSEVSMTEETPVAFTVSGLAPATAYYARLVVTNDLKGSATETLAAARTTVAMPFVLGAITVTTEDGRTTVSVEVEDLYSDSATLSLLVGAAVDPTETKESKTITEKGTYAFTSFEEIEGFSIAKVKLTTTKDGTTYETSDKRGTSEFWLANAETPTSITNMTSGVAFTCSSGTSGITLKKLADLRDATKIDLSKNIYTPSGAEVTLASIGTSMQQKAQLKEVVLSDSLTWLSDAAFQGDASSTGEITALEKVTLPKGLKKIPYRCFRKATKLKTVLPEDWTLAVTNLAAESFYYTALGGDLKFPNMVEFSSGCLTCTGIRSIDVTGAPLVKIDGFTSCGSLTNFTPLVAESVIYLGNMSWCSNLKRDLVVRNPRLTIGGGEHIRGAGFTSVDLGVTKIVNNVCFFDCGSLTNLVLPATFKAFWGTSALQSCGKLRTIRFLGGAPANLYTTCISYDQYLLLKVPKAGPANREWREYLATNATVTVPTATQKANYTKYHPGEKRARQMIQIKWDDSRYYRYLLWDGLIGLKIIVK